MRIKIAHLADVHVRGLSRHDEVREVVAALCADAKKRAVDHVVIAGDFWHTKASGLTPEYIELATWTFRSLAQVSKQVHVTLGNHDGVLTNLTRQDAVSPIVAAIGDPRIVVYKDSGTYKTNDGSFNLCVYSVFDPERWDAVVPVKGEYNVAVYHGPVAGAESETGWQLEAPVSVKWFDDKGFDLVLLGDIHKRQFLGHREQP